MAKILFAGFNGYGQCPGEDRYRFVVPDWPCLSHPDQILGISCAHTFLVLDTMDEYRVYGRVTVDSPWTGKSIEKPGRTTCFGTCDEYLAAWDENSTLWKYTYRTSAWTRWPVDLANREEKEEKAVWTGSKVVKVSFRSDTDDVIILLSNGSVWALSTSNKLQLLYPNEPDGAIDLVSGLEHTLILTESGCVLAFGNGSRGQLGNGSLNSSADPVQIGTLEGLKVTRIAAGNWHSCALTDSGDLCTWGWNSHGQLAAVEETGEEVGLADVPVFVDVGPDEDNNVVDVDCGARHTIVKLTNGDLYGTGWNAYRQLGLESSDRVSTFTKIANVGDCRDRKLVCGPWYTVLIDETAPRTKSDEHST